MREIPIRNLCFHFKLKNETSSRNSERNPNKVLISSLNPIWYDRGDDKRASKLQNDNDIYYMKGNEIQEIQHIPFFSTTKLYTWGFVFHAAHCTRRNRWSSFNCFFFLFCPLRETFLSSSSSTSWGIREYMESRESYFEPTAMPIPRSAGLLVLVFFSFFFFLVTVIGVFDNICWQ